MSWRETDGPEVKPAAAAGFGSVLIEQTLRSHGGEASLNYDVKGFTCEITLPIAQSETAAQLELDAPPIDIGRKPALQRDERSPGLFGKRILLIEDEPLVSMDIESILSGAGCAIHGPAGNIEKAKRLIDEGEYDGALVDANLEGHPIDEIAELLKQRDCPFAFVSGYGREALPAGFRNAVLVAKPYSRNQLLATVDLLVSPRAELMRPQDNLTRMQAEAV
jgi:CheY-like chemotaxis protein